MNFYFLMDLERTIETGLVFYWKYNRHGYTTVLQDAGIFDELEANKICGEDFDNRTIMICSKVVEKIVKNN